MPLDYEPWEAPLSLGAWSQVSGASQGAFVVLFSGHILAMAEAKHPRSAPESVCPLQRGRPPGLALLRAEPFALDSARVGRCRAASRGQEAGEPKTSWERAFEQKGPSCVLTCKLAKEGGPAAPRSQPPGGSPKACHLLKAPQHVSQAWLSEGQVQTTAPSSGRPPRTPPEPHGHPSSVTEPALWSTRPSPPCAPGSSASPPALFSESQTHLKCRFGPAPRQGFAACEVELALGGQFRSDPWPHPQHCLPQCPPPVTLVLLLVYAHTEVDSCWSVFCAFT